MSDFFGKKRDWSRYKDFILAYYLEPYIPKVNTLKRPILVVDCFAGRGEFGDGQPGSPVIIASAIEKWRAKGVPIRGLFIEADPDNHRHLSARLGRFGEYRRAPARDLRRPPPRDRPPGPPQHGLPLRRSLQREGPGLRADEGGLRPDPHVEFERRGAAELQLGHVHAMGVGGRCNGTKTSPPRRPTSRSTSLRTPRAAPWNWPLSTPLPGATTGGPSPLTQPSTSRRSSTASLRSTWGGCSRPSPTSPACDIKAKYHHRVPKYHLIYATRHQDGLELINDAMCKARREFLGAEFTKGLLFDLTPEEEVPDLSELRGSLLPWSPRRSASPGKPSG